MKKISVIVPVYNEESNLQPLFDSVNKVCSTINTYNFEFIFINDGSHDRSSEVVRQISEKNSSVRLVEFSRNFGKEAATSAGLREMTGDAAFIMDADLHHPPILIHDFIKKWESGAEIVMGIRRNGPRESFIKTIGSKVFYWIMDAIGDIPHMSQSTDFVLLDRVVVDEFNRLGEHHRITRGLLLWLGFRQDFIEFDALPRLAGEPGYSYKKLVHLAVSAFVQHSLFPLRIAGYLGMIITFFSALTGAIVFIQQFFFHSALGLYFSGTAFLALLIIFLVGTILMSLGVIALYIETIHTEVTNRPLYIIRRERKAN